MRAVTCLPSIGHMDYQAAAETPLISAHVRKACARAARYWTAET
jgi:hypothetical protein